MTHPQSTTYRCAYCQREFRPDQAFRRYCSRTCANRSHVWPSLAQRFWSKVDRSAGPDACWPWLAAFGSHGYGTFGWGAETQVAHRVAFTLTHGAIPKGMHVCHRCDYRPCCNPAHLFLGTPRDNVHDMIAKGRNAALFGERVYTAKLTTARVLEIRRRVGTGEITAVALAAEIGVSAQTVRSIVQRKTWRHLP